MSAPNVVKIDTEDESDSGISRLCRLLGMHHGDGGTVDVGLDWLSVQAALRDYGVGASDGEDVVAPSERSTIADEAQSAVYGDRGKDYGHPRENFTDTAALWSALLADRLSAPITPEDVARCMIAVKLARDLHSPKRDNRVDIVGYAITLDRLETGL